MAFGYKGRNAQFQEEVKKLKEQVSHYKELGLEGDRLYEEKIVELDEAKKEIARLKRMPCADAMLQTKCISLEEQVEKKNTFIEQLQFNVQDLKMQLDKAESTIESQKAIINELDETLVELNKPWWKKLFR
jgi:chromosome segregation ATPase